MTEPTDDFVNDIVVGRQGIFTLAGEIVGYELLFRQPPEHRIEELSGDEMTAQVVYRATAIGLDHLVSGRTIFCNADRGLIEGTVPLTLPPEQTVVEVRETVELDDDVIEGCRRLAQEGYQIAADNFVWRPGAERLLEVASIVKIDVMAVDAEDLADLAARCKEFDVTLLAQKVENAGDVPALSEMGFDLFQGYALERPQLIAGATIDASDLARLRLSADMLSQELDLEEIEEAVKRDPGLALQVMQLASVGRMGETRRKINSLREALVLAGSRRVQNWVALLLARPATGKTAHDRFTSTLIRARACELLATEIDRSLAPLGFAAGMLSAVDVLFGISPGQVRAALALSEELTAAAWGTETPVGRVVRDVTDFQLGKQNPPRLTRKSDDTMHDVFSSAFAWAVASSAALAEVDPAIRQR
jgi:EAL and modified HD-GYP domain-containing signal transduction protein